MQPSSATDTSGGGGRQLLAGRDRMAVIRGMGFSPEEEASLMALANDPTVVDLFRTIMPDTTNQEYMPYMREALLRVLHCAGSGLDAMNEQRLTAVDRALEQARVQFRKDLEKAVENALAEEATRNAAQLQLKLNQHQRKLEKQFQAERNETEVANRRTTRALCETLLDLEKRVAKKLTHVEQRCTAELKRLRIKQKLPFHDMPQSQRTAGEHALPPPPDPADPEFDPILHELESAAPDRDGVLHDLGTALGYKADCLIQGVQSMCQHLEDHAKARAAEAREEAEEMARVAAAEAERNAERLAEEKGARMADQALDAYKLELELAKPVLADAGCATDVTGEDMDLAAEKLAEAEEDQRRRDARLPRSTSMTGLPADPDSLLLQAGLQAISDMTAVVEQLSYPLPTEGQASLAQITTCVPQAVSFRLPLHSIPANRLRAMELCGMAPAAHNGRLPLQAPPPPPPGPGGTPNSGGGATGLSVLSLRCGGEPSVCVFDDSGAGGGVDGTTGAPRGSMLPPAGSYLDRIRSPGPLRCGSAGGRLGRSGGGGGGGGGAGGPLAVEHLHLVPKRRCPIPRQAPEFYGRAQQPLSSKAYVFAA